MSGDLLVIVPSRGRPRNIARLLSAVHATRQADTHVHVAVDEDDPEASAYQAVMDDAGADGDVLEVGSAKGLCAWTNEVAVRKAGSYPSLASLGDDMIPRTPGWDRALIRGIADMGGTGFTYPFDGVRQDIPEAVVMSSDIVTALGWMCLPDVAHWFCDDAWAALGKGAGCIRHLRAIAVDHVRGPADPTSAGNGKSFEADRDAYWAWRHSRAADDIKTILRLREKALQPA